MSELETLCRALGIKARAARSARPAPAGWTAGTTSWKVSLTFQGRRLTVPFHMGPACKGEPSLADVLGCLASDTNAGEMSFDEFVSEFGYDADKRKQARTTWAACAAMAPRVRTLLGDRFGDVANAQH